MATAIYDGADAVMLSGETAVGKYATETVNMQQRIIERYPHRHSHTEATHACSYVLIHQCGGRPAVSQAHRRAGLRPGPHSN